MKHKHAYLTFDFARKMNDSAENENESQQLIACVEPVKIEIWMC